MQSLLRPWFEIVVLLAVLASASVSADDATQLTDHPDNDRTPAWSPVGDMMVYTRDDGNVGRLYVQDLVGGEPMSRVPTSTNPIHPTWSPDGTGIWFSRLDVLWFLDTVGGSVNQVSSPLDGADPDQAPAISSTGMIAVQAIMRFESEYSIAYFTRAGGTAEKLTTEAGNHRFPTWSPDGTQLAFMHDNDIETIAFSGGPQVPLVTSPFVDTHPAWSPDGDWVAFASNRSGTSISGWRRSAAATRCR